MSFVHLQKLDPLREKLCAAVGVHWGSVQENYWVAIVLLISAASVGWMALSENEIAHQKAVLLSYCVWEWGQCRNEDSKVSRGETDCGGREPSTTSLGTLIRSPEVKNYVTVNLLPPLKAVTEDLHKWDKALQLDRCIHKGEAPGIAQWHLLLAGTGV